MFHARRRILLLVASFLLLVGLIAWAVTRPGDAFEEKYRRVHVGMTRQEVEGILGEPFGVWFYAQEIDTWWEDGRSIDVIYDSADTVERKDKSWETGLDKFRKRVLGRSPLEWP
jgi:hypothetical protein